jgi:CxxC-x17-CxxC domain-containing protein
MEYSDKSLTCVECGQPFVFSVGEQIFFSEKQFQHEPKRCKTCKARGANTRVRVETSVTCAACGAPTTVPFLPNQKRPVLCRVCFHKQREGSVRARVLEQAESIEDRREGLASGGELVG